MKKLFTALFLFLFVGYSYSLENNFVYDEGDILTQEQEDSLRNLPRRYEVLTTNQFVVRTIIEPDYIETL